MSQSSFLRERDDDLIPWQAVAVLTVATLVNLNFLGAPRSVVEAARQDAWIAIALNGFAVALAMTVMYAVIRRHPGDTLVEIARTLLGRWLGALLVLLYVAIWLFMAGATVKLQGHLFTRSLLPNTPPVVLNAYLLLLAVYMARHGIEPMTRFFLLVIPVFFLAMSAIGVFTLSRYDWGRLLPVMEEGFMPVLKGLWITYGSSYGTEFILMIGPTLTRLRGGLKAAFVGIAFTSIPGVMLNVLLLIRFGVEGVSNFTWATLSLIATADVPGFTGFRLDPVFLGVWTVFVFCTLSFHLYLIAAVFKRLLSLEDGDWPVVGAAGVILGLSLLDVNPIDVQRFLQTNLRWSTPVITLVIPLTLLGLTMVRQLTTKGRLAR